MAQMIFDNNHPCYIKDLEKIAEYIPFESLEGKGVGVTGATGLIGILLVDALMWVNNYRHANIPVFALVRNVEKAKEFFSRYIDSPLFHIIPYSVELTFPKIDVSYIFHCAGNSHPALFAKDPVGTIMGNILGVVNLLEFAYPKEITSLVLSSGEVYGENLLSSKSKFSEDCMGYLPIDNPRACYSEGKRAIEAICQSYKAQYKADIRIARPCRIFGPTMSYSDNKATAQFLKRAKIKEDIILKSKGEQKFSFIYGADAASALFAIMFKGQNGVVYNISNEMIDLKLKEFASKVSELSGVKLVYNLIGEEGGSKVTNAILDNSRIKMLGWSPEYNLEKSIINTLEILL